MTQLGNFPAGGALTTNGRFLWTLSAGRGKNDIRIVRVETGKRAARASAASAAGAEAQAADRPRRADDPDAGRERRHRDGARRPDRLRLGHAGVDHGLRPAAGGHARARGRRHPRVPLQREEGQGDARRRDRGPRPGRHAAAAGLPAHAHRPGLVAARPRDQPGREDAARRAQPRPQRRDHRHGVEGRRVREDRALPLRRGDHARRREGARLQRGRRHRLGDRPRGRERGEGDHGRAAPLAPRGHGDRPEGGSRLRGGDPPGPGARDQHEDDGGRAQPVGRAAAGARHGPGGGERHARRAAADREQLRRGRGRGVRAAGRGREELAARAARRRRPPARGPAQRRAGRDRARGGGRDLRRGGRGGGRGREGGAAGAAQAEGLGADRARAHGLLPDLGGRDAAQAQPRVGDGRGRRVGPELAAARARPCRATPARRPAARRSRSGSSTCPRTRSGAPACSSSRSDKRLRKLTPRASRQIRPSNAQKPPAGHAAQDAGAAAASSSTSSTSCARTAPTTRSSAPTRAATATRSSSCSARRSRRTRTRWRERFPLLDHVYANSEASIDGHFWTSAAAVSDYVSKNWHANYGGRNAAIRLRRPTPSPGRPRASCSTRRRSRGSRGSTSARRSPASSRSKDDDRTPEETAAGRREVPQVRPRHDARVPAPVPGRRRRRRVLPERRLLGRGRRGALGRRPRHRGVRLDAAAAGHGQTQDAPDATAQSRFDCFKQKFEQQLAAGRRAAVHLHHLRERPHGRHHAGPAHAERDDRRERLGARRDRRADLEVADLEGLADPRDRGRLAGRRRPRGRAPDPRVRDQPVREARRGRAHALRLPVVHPHARDRGRHEAAQPLRRRRRADVRRLHAEPGQRRALRGDRAERQPDRAEHGGRRRTPRSRSGCRSTSPTARRSATSTRSCGSTCTARTPSRRRPARTRRASTRRAGAARAASRRRRRSKRRAPAGDSAKKTSK